MRGRGLAVYELLNTGFLLPNASSLGGYQTDALSLTLPHDGGGDGLRYMPPLNGAEGDFGEAKNASPHNDYEGDKGGGLEAVGGSVHPSSECPIGHGDPSTRYSSWECAASAALWLPG